VQGYEDFTENVGGDLPALDLPAIASTRFWKQTFGSRIRSRTISNSLQKDGNGTRFGLE
jgi:hypothetical protein